MTKPVLHKKQVRFKFVTETYSHRSTLQKRHGCEEAIGEDSGGDKEGITLKEVGPICWHLL